MSDLQKDITREFGMFQVKLTETEAVISDKANEAFSFVTYMGTREHALISFLITSGGKESEDALEMLVYLTASMRMIFSNEDFNNGVYNLLMENVGKQGDLSYEEGEETEEEIIEGLRKEQEAKEKAMSSEQKKE